MNGDGINDMITGHYWPGDIHIFYGLSDGSFGKMDHLKDEDGKNLNAGEPWEDENEPRMESLAAAPFASDWDGDGDFDMLIGNILGGIVYMENIGNAKEPKFTTNRIAICADGEEIKVPMGDSGPVHADWDADGIRDLIVGCGDGSVRWYKNVGSEKAPEFAASQVLIGEIVDSEYPNGAQPARPGSRVKVCVTDYNADGKVDLLVGGYTSEKGAIPNLSEKELKRRDELSALIDGFQAEAMEIQASSEDVAAEYGRDSDEYKNCLEKGQEQMADKSAKFSEWYQEYGKYTGQSTTHGFVWVYLRKDEGLSNELSLKR